MTSIDYAIEMARKIPYAKGEQRHYSVVLDKRGKILAEAENSYIKSSPKMLKAGRKVGLDEKIFWHAECRALYSIKNSSKIYKLIVARVDAQGNAASSAPCKLCENVIKEKGVKVIEYTV